MTAAQLNTAILRNRSAIWKAIGYARAGKGRIYLKDAWATRNSLRRLRTYIPAPRASVLQ